MEMDGGFCILLLGYGSGSNICIFFIEFSGKQTLRHLSCVHSS